MDMEKVRANRVVQGIKDMIVNGELTPGARYPSERVLAQRFGVSRNTVREAIQYFVMVGVASTKPGSGTYLVNDTDALKKMMDARQMLEKYNWTEIQQARRVIEMGIIKLAAHNANREDKIRLRNALQKLDEAGKKVETDAEINAYLNADYELHEEIARITHNTILMELHASLREGILSLAEVWKRFANLVDIVNPTHRKIVDAIARNDEEEAAAAMDEHLRYMEYRIELNRTTGSRTGTCENPVTGTLLLASEIGPSPPLTKMRPLAGFLWDYGSCSDRRCTMERLCSSERNSCEVSTPGVCRASDSRGARRRYSRGAAPYCRAKAR